MSKFPIVLHAASTTTFSSLGIGSLNDALSCRVVEELNGEFELEMVYPIDGKRYKDLGFRRIIAAQPNPYDSPQAFRIYNISTPLNGQVTVSAQHISYDLSGYPIDPFKTTSAAAAMVKLKSGGIIDCPFDFSTNITNTTEMSITIPTTIRKVMGVNCVTRYGGEWEFNNFGCRLLSARGVNRGLVLRYGKNLIDLQQEANCAGVYTAVYPYWFSEEDKFVKLTEKTIATPGTWDFDRIFVLDTRDHFYEKPTEKELRDYTNDYIKKEKLEVPKISIEVDFVQLSRSGEYAQLAALDKCYLGDTVVIEFIKGGVSATAKCIRTEFDVLAHKYIKIELGDAKSRLSHTISDSLGGIRDKIDTTETKWDAIFGSIKVAVADIDYALIKKADIDYLEANYAKIENGHINNAVIADASITKAKIADGAIGNAQISDLSASKINAGILNTNLLTIKGTNGRMSIVDNTLKVNDGTNDRVVLGLLDTDKYGLQIKNSGGSILIDENGITNGGWLDGYNKQGNGSVDPGKLDIDKTVVAINGAQTKINSGSIVVGDKSLDLSVKEITDSIIDINNELVNLGASYTILIDKNVIAIPTSTDGAIVMADDYEVAVRVYNGTNELRTFTVEFNGTIPSGIDDIQAVNHDDNRSLWIYTSDGSVISGSSVSFDIVIDGTKFSRTVSILPIPQGGDGAPARLARIDRTASLFTTGDGGTTWNPPNITLTPVLQNVTFNRWQYNTGNGVWMVPVSGQNGITINNTTKALTINYTSALYKDSNTVAFKVLTGDADAFDVVDVSKLYVMTDETFQNIKTNSADIKVLKDSIVLKVSSDDYTKDMDGVTKRFETNESSIKLVEGSITSKVDKTVFDALGTRVTQAEQKITDDAITNTVSRNVKDLLKNLIPHAEDQWEQGGLSSSGANSASTIRLRTKAHHPISSGEHVIGDWSLDGYDVYMHYYNDSYAWISGSGWFTSFPAYPQVPANAAYYRMVYRYRANNNATMTTNIIYNYIRFKMVKGNQVGYWTQNGNEMVSASTILSPEGFRVKAGKMTVENANGVVTIDGSYNMHKIVSTTDLSLNAGSNLDYTYTLKHNLGFVPAFLCFQVDTAYSTGGNTHFPALNISGGVVTRALRCNADDTNIYIVCTRTTSTVTGVFKVRVFIYKEALI